jgi:ribosomal protein S18 acetylase RimI-like enzyme
MHDEAIQDLLDEADIPEGVKVNVDFAGATQGHAEFDRIEVPLRLRNKGYASKVLHLVCKYFDAANLSVSLSVRPLDDHTDHDRLVAWYSTFGFRLNGGDGMEATRMARLLNATATE